jgi:hypothetical protein
MTSPLQPTSTDQKQALASSKTMIAEGAIFYSSWGYEQTNIDFYQVVGVTEKTVKVRAIEADRTYSSQTMTGEATPKKDCFIGDVFTRKLKHDGTVFRINSFSHAYIWDGKPKSFSTYA